MAENGTNGNGVPGAEGATGGGNQPGQEKTYTQEELDKAIQSESDKRVNQALENAKAKWEKEYTEKLQAEKDEAARLAKLSADERAKAEFNKEKEQFNTEREAYKKEKLEYECAKQLASRGLDVTFASFLTGADAETTKTNIDSFNEAFKKAVEASVTDRLKGSPPSTGNGGGADSFLANIRKGAGLK